MSLFFFFFFSYFFQPLFKLTRLSANSVITVARAVMKSNYYLIPTTFPRRQLFLRELLHSSVCEAFVFVYFWTGRKVTANVRALAAP